jgi:hypothetical protein
MSHEMVELGSGNPRVPTKEELLMIRDSIFLPIILDIAQKNRQQVERTTWTFKQLFEKILLGYMDLVTQELARVKRELKIRNIRVFEDGQRDQILYHRFICRGYEERFGMIKEVVRAEISVRMGKFEKDFWNGFSGRKLSVKTTRPKNEVCTEAEDNHV